MKSPHPALARATALALATAAPIAPIVLTPALAGAEPLAVHVPDVEGRPVRGRPTHAQWLQLADAVSAALAERLPEVLGAGETANRVGLLDPAQLLCDAPRCASEMAALLHVRGVVLVRPALDGHTLGLDLIAVAPNGSTQASVHGEATVGAWADAVALGRVLGAQLATAMLTPAPTPSGGDHTPEGGSGTSAGNPAPVQPPPRRDVPPAPAAGGGPSVPEVVLGGALFLGGAAAAIAGAWVLTGPTQCAPDAACNPPASMNPSPQATYTSPSDLNWGWVIGGGVAAIGGAVLLVDGLRSHGGAAPGHASRSHAPRVAGAIGPGGGAVTVTLAF